MATNMTRKVTNKLLELIEEGAIDAETILRCCFNYMSEDDVADMARAEGLFDDEEEEEEDDADMTTAHEVI